MLAALHKCTFPGESSAYPLPPKAKSLFYEKTLLLPCAAFFQPVYKNIWNRLFFSREPLKPLLPDTIPKIQFPFWKINNFMKEQPPTSAFHREFRENRPEMAREITQR